jgi:predicted permease
MGWTDLYLRLRALVRRGRAEGELDEELRFHMEMEARKQRAAGVTDEEAKRSAHALFGGVEQVREECRDVRGLSFLENLARDIRYGARLLRKTPVFTAIAVLSLAIGIGANTAVFSLVNTVMLRMLPVRSPEQLVVAKWGAHKSLDISANWATGGDDGHGGWTENVFSWAAFSEMRRRNGALRDAIGFSPLGPVSVMANGQALPTGAMVISGNYFQALGVRTAIGRPILDDDDKADGFPSAVIAYRFWERAFAREPSAIGKTLYVNGQPCTIVGVTPKEFFGVSPGGFMMTPQVDIMLPIRFRDRMQNVGQKPVAWFVGDLLWIQVMGRLKPGSEAAAKSELSAIVKANLPESARSALGTEAPRVYLDPGGQGLDSLRRAFRQPLLILMSVVGLTLLMACANLAGLLLARAAARQKEIMLRLAVGASRSRLVRQLLVEGAVLSAAGAVAALAFAWWGVRALVAMAASGSAPIPVDVSPDARVFAFTAAVSLATTFLFALAPALRATRVDVAGGLKQDTAAAPAIRSFGMGSVLVVVQVAVALVLLVGATLFTRSLANLRSLPLGFNQHNVVVFDIAPGENGYDEVRGNQLYMRLRERLNQTRGVMRASLSRYRLIGGWVSNGPILPDGKPDPKGVQSDWNLVGPDFFETTGIPVIAGRGLELRDMAPTPRVAVMNETLARQCFGGESPVGRRFRVSWRKDWDVEVIGVVKDAKFDRLRGDPPATFYAPYTQATYGFQPQMSFEVRTAGNTAEAIAGIRRAVADVDRTLPIMNVKTQETQIDDSLTQEHVFATLVSLFSAITLALACVGLYGSVAYTVTRRTRELGVRMALGASRIRVLRMLLGQVALTVAAGLALGLPATWMLTRIVESQLYGIKPHDPASMAIACIGVACVAAAAALLPAQRAMRIDPVRALRYE